MKKEHNFMAKRFELSLVVAIVCLVMSKADATITHIVGGDVGWTLLENDEHFYERWAKGRVFGVGDKLLFSYKPPSSNVMRVKREDYEMCTQRDPIDSWYSGQTVIELDRPGDYYFFGAVGLHCKIGQRIHVHVINGPGKAGIGDFDLHFHPRSMLSDVVGKVPPASEAAGPVKDAVLDKVPAASAAAGPVKDAVGPAGEAAVGAGKAALAPKVAPSASSDSDPVQGMGMVVGLVIAFLVALLG